MVTKEDLEKRYKELSLGELLDIIENKFEYTELAVIVALEEISKRDITEKDIQKHKQEQVRIADDFINKNVVDDLSLIQKAFYFYLWFLFFTDAFRANLLHDGYILKFRQAKYYSWTGFLSCIINSLIQTQLGFSFLIFLVIWTLLFILVLGFDEFFNRNVQRRKLQVLFKQNEGQGYEEEGKD